MLGSEKTEIANFRANYATRADFCEVLERELKPFYLLTFLLTANHKKAEECLNATVEEALEERGVFRDWTRSWIKRSLTKNAIRVAHPVLSGGSQKPDLWCSSQHQGGGGEEIDAVTQLPPLERFVFVMSILERYSVWDCSSLLGSSTKRVILARMQALRELPNPVGFFPGVEERASHFFEIPA